MRLLCSFAIVLSTSLTAIAQTGDRPACKALKELYVELAKRSGVTPSQTEIEEAVYGENPTNAECQAMLALFPVQE